MNISSVFNKILMYKIKNTTRNINSGPLKNYQIKNTKVQIQIKININKKYYFIMYIFMSHIL